MAPSLRLLLNEAITLLLDVNLFFLVYMRPKRIFFFLSFFFFLLKRRNKHAIHDCYTKIYKSKNQAHPRTNQLKDILSCKHNKFIDANFLKDGELLEQKLHSFN